MTKRMRLLFLTAAAAIAGVTVSCSSSGDDAASSSPAAPTTTVVATLGDPGAPGRDDIDDRFDLPPEARAATRGGNPRPPAYWAVWNTCAPDNRSAEAEANGGTDAGWYLVDDVLVDPGIGLGDHILTTCEESVALLEGRTATGDETADPAFTLAAQLLAAELNLNIGAETCPAAEEAVVGAQIVLSAARFDGVSASPLDAEAGGALPQLIDLLAAYNTGVLCR